MKIIKEYMLLSRDSRMEHIDLSIDCLERGGNSTNHRGVLAQFLNTEIPMGWSAVLCHRCNNDKCSNPQHLYWGTSYENNCIDGLEFGTWKPGNKYLEEKYGSASAVSEHMKKIRTKESCAKGGRAGKDKPKSEEQKIKISEALKNKNVPLAQRQRQST